jgi:hypothetical protein
MKHAEFAEDTHRKSGSVVADARDRRLIMSYLKVVTSLGFVAALALAAPPAASAQHQSRGRAVPHQSRGRAVPRGSVRPSRPPVRVAPYRPHYYRSYRPHVNLGFFYGYPGYYGGYGYRGPGYGYVPYGYGSPAYGYIAPYGYGYDGYSGQPYGGVRIDLPQRQAEVYVDDYFVGTVNDFDGALQQANLEAGPHHIEVRAPGYETITFDVNVEPGRTITYRASMHPLQP